MNQFDHKLRKKIENLQINELNGHTNIKSMVPKCSKNIHHVHNSNNRDLKENQIDHKPNLQFQNSFKSVNLMLNTHSIAQFFGSKTKPLDKCVDLKRRRLRFLAFASHLHHENSTAIGGRRWRPVKVCGWGGGGDTSMRRRSGGFHLID